MMEKMTSSPWFLRLLAVAFALLLFTYVNNENNKQFSADDRSGGATVTSSEMITDLPIMVNVDQERYYVTGLPETASILLEGSTAILLNTVTTKSFDIVTPNLNDMGVGTYTISLLPEGLSDELNYTIYPSEVTVNIQERASVEHEVMVSFDEGALADGYVAGVPQVDTPTVSIEGAAATLEEVANVQAVVPIEEGTNRNISKSVPVLVTDEAGNELDVRVVPSEVNVTIPVESNAKEVSLSLIQTGVPETGVEYEIDFADSNDSKANLLGNQSALESVSEIEIPVDISGMTKTSTMDVTIPVPEGASSVDPESVQVEITVTKNESESNAEETDKETPATEENSSVSGSGSNSEESEEEVESSSSSRESSQTSESAPSQSSGSESGSAASEEESSSE